MNFNSEQQNICARCGAEPSHRYQQFNFRDVGEESDHKTLTLCVRCARAERRRQIAESSIDDGLMKVSREELIKEVDRYFEESGAMEICGLCHQQGTGCCPPSCRSLTDQGCSRKNLWCSAFVCGALINAIDQCDPQSARTLRWARRETGPTEFRIYEMMTRVPAEFREPERPLVLPRDYPGPLRLSRGSVVRDKLLAMSKDVLEIRRMWHEEELRECAK
jgi:hypothetical protein